MKKYILLYTNEDGAYMLVPVKASLNPYNKKSAYCGNMPQFFGGTDEGPEILKKEVDEESRQTLQLDDYDKTAFITIKDPNDHKEYSFYKSEKWSPGPNKNWDKGPTKPEYMEMQGIKKVEKHHFMNLKTDDEIIAKLLELTKMTDRTPAQIEQFNKSHTRQAFILFIKDWIKQSN